MWSWEVIKLRLRLQARLLFLKTSGRETWQPSCWQFWQPSEGSAVVAFRVCPSFMASRVLCRDLTRERPVLTVHLELRSLVPSVLEDDLTQQLEGLETVGPKAEGSSYVFHGEAEIELGPGTHDSNRILAFGNSPHPDKHIYEVPWHIPSFGFQNKIRITALWDRFVSHFTERNMRLTGFKLGRYESAITTLLLFPIIVIMMIIIANMHMFQPLRMECFI